MIISKKAQTDYQTCQEQVMDIDCETCKANEMLGSFEICSLIEFAQKERIWYCAKCDLIGNKDEFTSNLCKRCRTAAEEITLEK